MENFKECIELLREKHAEDILIIDLSLKSPLFDRFIVCTVRSPIQARSIADALMEKIDKRCNGVWGYDQGEWVLIDLDTFVVHIFLEEVRRFYNIEELYSDAVFEEVDWHGERS